MNIVDAIIYDTQNEFAPDNPFGREILELNARGGLKYRRQRQVVLAEVSGYVAPEGFFDILEALKRTAFPLAPQATFVPGASVVSITTLPFNEFVDIDYDRAQEFDGYGYVVSKLEELVSALRVTNDDVLRAWRFTPDAEKTTTE